MKLKTTNIKKSYYAPYAEVIWCTEEDCLLDTVSAIGEDSGGGGSNEEFAKGMSFWDEGYEADITEDVSTIFDYEP